MHTATQPIKVLIAGIGGASLGTEICKCLRLAGSYAVYGCDISSTAYGLYDASFDATYKVDKEHYVEDVLRVCIEQSIQWLIPGGEQPTVLLGAAAEHFAQHGITVVTNDAQTIRIFSDKKATFDQLEEYGIAIPKTCELTCADDAEYVGLPCIVKPATGTGGSASVFFAITTDEALLYADFIRRNGSVPIAQEYVSEEEGEFTIGVLSLPNGVIAGSIALKRVLDAKLSVAYRGRGGVISSGYSQGLIDDFADIRAQAEQIATLIGSRGPINIQGRVRHGQLMPFEINPRFSASSYLRALAGHNEIDILLQHLISGAQPKPPSIKSGLYLRSLTETFVAKEAVK